MATLLVGSFLFQSPVLAVGFNAPVGGGEEPCADGGEDPNFKTGFGCVDELGTKSGIEAVTKDNIVTKILEVTKVLLQFVGIAAVIVVIIGGVMYMTSLGDETKAERAKKVLLYAIIGLAIIGAAIIIVNLIIGTFQGGGAGGGAGAGNQGPGGLNP